VIHTMARYQADRGIEVHVATTDDNGTERIHTGGHFPLFENAVTYWIFRRQTRFYTFSFPLTRWLWKHSADYDLIHIHALFSYPAIAAAFCARWASVPYVVRPLGTLNRWGMRHRRRWLKSLSFRFIESRILRRAAVVQYTSEQEAVEAKLLDARHQAIVIPNPVELLGPERTRGTFRTRYPALAGKTVLLFLSRLDPKKGLDLLLPALSVARDQNPEVALVIAGDGDPAFVAGLKKQAEQLGLEKCVLWVGFLRANEKRAALADSDVYVLPSYSENFGVAVVEAMGAGIPVIVSDQVGIHREIAKAGAGLVAECRVEALAAALTQVLGDSEWRVAASERAARLAARFAPEIITAQLAELYGRIRIRHDRPAAA
jgi:glycosyltransferase involved in cell wall biosynthesis